jgi:hypothetical protein
MLFNLPFYNWLNHGFYNFNPILFVDLAAVNRYEMVRLSLACPVGQELRVIGQGSTDSMRFSWQPRLPALSLADFQRRGSIRPRTVRNLAYWLLQAVRGRNASPNASPLARATSKLAERSPNVSVVAALRKTEDSPFAVPLQGMYSGENVQTEELRARYRI